MRFMMLAALATTGCSQEQELRVDHLSTMQSTTNGLVLADDGQTGHGAMSGTTCSFDTLNGWLINDYDLPGDDESIEDHRGGHVVGVSKRGVHVIKNSTEGWGWETNGDSRYPDVEMEGVVTSRFSNDGLVVVQLREDCRALFADGSVVALDISLCAPDVDTEVRRTDGTIYAATGTALWEVSHSYAEQLTEGVVELAYDDRTDTIYATDGETSDVTVIPGDSSPTWTFTAPGTVTSITPLSGKNAVAVLVEQDNGGAIAIYDGEGAEVSFIETPSSDATLTGSLDGTTLAVTLDTEVHFYDVYANDQDKKKRNTLGNDPSPTFSD
jgi:hypothetical protein